MSTIRFSSVKLVKGGVVSGDNKAADTFITDTDTYYSFGSSSQLWGLTLSPSDVNASNFGVAISLTGDDASVGPSNNLIVTDFGFSILTGSTITGVLVEIETKETNSGEFVSANVDYVRVTISYLCALTLDGPIVLTGSQTKKIKRTLQGAWEA